MHWTKHPQGSVTRPRSKDQVVTACHFLGLNPRAYGTERQRAVNADDPGGLYGSQHINLHWRCKSAFYASTSIYIIYSEKCLF